MVGYENAPPAYETINSTEKDPLRPRATEQLILDSSLSTEHALKKRNKCLIIVIACLIGILIGIGLAILLICLGSSGSDPDTDSTIKSTTSSTHMPSTSLATTTPIIPTTTTSITTTTTTTTVPSTTTTTTTIPPPIPTQPPPPPPKHTLPVGSTCSSACDYAGNLVPLLRSYNGKDHFYTTNAVEHAGARGYANEGTVGFLGVQGLSDSHCTCLRPLFRLYHDKAGDHFYTSNEAERDSAMAVHRYRLEGIIGYCAAEPACGAYLPLYRFWSASARDHFYTTSNYEMTKVKSPSSGYTFEGIQCYLWQAPVANQACL